MFPRLIYSCCIVQVNYPIGNADTFTESAGPKKKIFEWRRKRRDQKIHDGHFLLLLFLGSDVTSAPYFPLSWFL